ncbi:uncharacterized protein K441DRAFT_677416 [Cenococcum geophilum 1.58]|uniref:uncharacterized protein n=1 Tax=Cenococcum geophilum 1.58 TaxID=794803 RepID=UPI00358EF748|nr:hypothetical protein K441DRAFT_677416 [Cenococcum geophilum 1.58]
MATQDEGGIPFSISQEQQQFRLLELPPALLDLIASPNPPVLSIKSQAVSTPSSNPSSKPAYAVLCTSNKTFQLRQVQTSNSVFVTQPISEPQGNDIPLPGLVIIATCTATLELHPVCGSAIPYLRTVLPVYDTSEDTVDAGNAQNKLQIFSNIPLSDDECEAGWRELVAFELAGSSYRPTAKTLLQIWRSINAAASAEGINLESQFLTDDLHKAIEDEGYPPILLTSLLSRLVAEDENSSGAWTCLDAKKCVQWVGRMVLEVRAGDSGLLTAYFLDAWRDCLPEAWRQEAELEAIHDSYILPTSTTIAFKGGLESSEKGPSEPSAKAGSSRKWHERFARARRH